MRRTQFTVVVALFAIGATVALRALVLTSHAVASVRLRPVAHWSLAQVLAHIAGSQFSTCASLKGASNPMAGRTLEKELATKAAVIKALQDSFDFCDGAVSQLSDATASELVRVGRGEAARAAVIAGLLAHTSEMYGISTVYLRARNLTPY